MLMADKSEGDSALGRHCIWGASSASAAAFDTALAGLDMLASRKVVAVRSPDRGMGRRWKIRIYQFHRFSPQASRKPQNQLISWRIWLCGMQPGSLRRRSRESRALHERSVYSLPTPSYRFCGSGQRTIADLLIHFTSG